VDCEIEEAWTVKRAIEVDKIRTLRGGTRKLMRKEGAKGMVDKAAYIKAKGLIVPLRADAIEGGFIEVIAVKLSKT